MANTKLYFVKFFFSFVRLEFFSHPDAAHDNVSMHLHVCRMHQWTKFSHSIKHEKKIQFIGFLFCCFFQINLWSAIYSSANAIYVKLRVIPKKIRWHLATPWRSMPNFQVKFRIFYLFVWIAKIIRETFSCALYIVIESAIFLLSSIHSQCN